MLLLNAEILLGRPLCIFVRPGQAWADKSMSKLDIEAVHTRGMPTKSSDG